MKQNQTALDAFISHKNAIDHALNRLQTLSAEHFGVNPDHVHWGHVGNLAQYAKELTYLYQRADRDCEQAVRNQSNAS